MNKKNNRKGFTIVELVIVIAVIAILASVLIPTFSGVVEKANKSKALQEVKSAYTATLAEVLSDNDSANDNSLDSVVVNYTGFYIQITNGNATVVSGSDTATHTVDDGKLVAI